jgi:hypothetical protein
MVMNKLSHALADCWDTERNLPSRYRWLTTMLVVILFFLVVTFIVYLSLNLILPRFLIFNLIF